MFIHVLYFVFEIRVFPFLEAGCSADSTTQQYATCTRVRTCSLKIVLVIVKLLEASTPE